MNINLNDFLPTLCEPSLKKIYKDFPGWQEKLLPIEHMHIVDFYGNPTTISITRHPHINTNSFDGFGVIRCDLDGDRPSKRKGYIPSFGYNTYIASDPLEFAEHIFEKPSNGKRFEKLADLCCKEWNRSVGMYSNKLTKKLSTKMPIDKVAILSDFDEILTKFAYHKQIDLMPDYIVRSDGSWYA